MMNPSRFATSTLRNNLLGLWEFDEGTGATASDSSGHGLTSTLLGSTLPTWVAGKRGNAVNFGATGDPFVRNIFNSYNLPEVSVSFWFKSTQSGFQCLLASGTEGSARGFYVFLDATGHIQWYVNGSAAFLTTPLTYIDGTWHHVVVTNAAAGNPLFTDAAKRVKIYMDGALVAEGANNYTGFIQSNPYLYIGSSPPLTDGYVGAMDQVAIWGRPLVSAEAILLYGAGAGMNF